MTNTIALDEKYATTRMVTKEKPEIINNPEDKFESILFLPMGEGRKGEGGLRTKGYFKRSQEGLPLISIITVVFNGEKYLEETIQSVVNQTYDNVEYIIIDGGSTDGTLDIIKKYEHAIDYWVSEKDRGIYDAMNKGIGLACGEIIGLVNSDDTLYSETLQNVARAFCEDNTMGFVHGKLDVIDEEKHQITTRTALGIKHFKYRWFKHMPFLHPTIFVKKEVYNTVGFFDTQYKICADYDFVLRLVEKGVTSRELDIRTGRFRLGGASSSIKTHLEGYRLLKGRLFFVLRYINTAILLLKFWLRSIKN